MAPPTSEKTEKRPQDAGSDTEDDTEIFHDARFPPEEEARLLSESHSLKFEANALYSAKSYDQAISTYDRAIASCPTYLDYEIAVIRSNMSACYIKLEDWKAAVDCASACVEGLERVIPTASVSGENEGEKKKKDAEDKDGEDAAVVEISDNDEESEEEQLRRLKEADERKGDVARIRAKALMRRARAKTELGGWGNLQGAEEDYKLLAGMENLSADDRKIVQKALGELPARIGKAREAEMGEMMGKLKDLGNGILKPFGLSTDNFNFVQDPKTGGYSVNFSS
ncbi:tetratricopeptide repeat protein 1 [Aspergillus stella-maris]|uniref:tetratricopeptide repeat protein 1 n=1 Tax=Aspergillus stella-maris TaxID=1810926 RepID=UPI003CCCAD0E